MIPQCIGLVVEEACRMQTPADKVMVLRRNNSKALRTYLKMALDPNLQWVIPEGCPPFKQNTMANGQPMPDMEVVLHNELRRMYIFLKGGQPNLKSGRAEQLFVNLLETLHPKDAEFLVNVVKDKKLPQGLSKEIIIAAFPEDYR